MKKKTTIKTGLVLGWIVLLLAAVLLAGCSLSGETIRDRIGKFIDAVNAGDEQGIKDCLDPTANMYNTASTTNLWNTYFPDRPYSIVSCVISGNTATVGFDPTGTSSTLSYVFEMTENKPTFLGGTTYSIRRISNNGTAFFY